MIAGGDRMSRVQLSINVSDFDAAVAFYSRLFGVAPAKLRPGYANFAIDDPPLKLVLNCPGNGPGGTINHLGVEVGSTGEVTAAGTRLDAEGLDTEPEPGAVCSYALQDKVWAHDRDGVAWEYYTVLEHIETP
jgi:catechol 2,3-dioxygenase-like lactoylglutathione lyase family enzyme